MKRLISIILLAILLLTACGKSTEPSVSQSNSVLESESQSSESRPYIEPEPVEIERYYFEVDKLTDIEDFDNGEIYSRYNKERTTEFVPSDKYGRLYPFWGGTTYKNEGEQRDSFGLCTEKGEVVVDPVYTSVTDIVTDNGKGYYFLVLPPVETDKEFYYSEFDNIGAWLGYRIVSEIYFQKDTLLIPQNGTSAMKLRDVAGVVAVGDNIHIKQAYKEGSEYYLNIQIYDSELKLINNIYGVNRYFDMGDNTAAIITDAQRYYIDAKGNYLNEIPADDIEEGEGYINIIKHRYSQCPNCGETADRELYGNREDHAGVPEFEYHNCSSEYITTIYDLSGNIICKIPQEQHVGYNKFAGYTIITANDNTVIFYNEETGKYDILKFDNKQRNIYSTWYYKLNSVEAPNNRQYKKYSDFFMGLHNGDISEIYDENLNCIIRFRVYPA